MGIVQVTLTSISEVAPEVRSSTVTPDNPLIIGREPDVTKRASNFINLDSRVVSRSHATVEVDHTGKVYVKDIKSSAGTFLNNMRLSPPKTVSSRFELADGDVLQFGEDCMINQVHYKSEVFRVTIQRPSSPRSEQNPRHSVISQMSSGNIPSLPTKAELELSELWDIIVSKRDEETPYVHALLEEVAAIIHGN